MYGLYSFNSIHLSPCRLSARETATVALVKVIIYHPSCSSSFNAWFSLKHQLSSTMSLYIHGLSFPYWKWLLKYSYLRWLLDFECFTVKCSPLLNVIVAVSKWFAVFLCYQYTMQDLLERIQASEEETKTHLKTIHACQIDGKQSHYLNCSHLHISNPSYT